MPDEKSPLQRIEELGRAVESLKKELDRLTEENARLRKENEIYRQKVDRFVRHHYGSRSESISENQLELLLQGLERSAGAVPPVPPVEPKRPRSQRRSHRPRFALNDQNLPTREEVLEPAEVLKDPEGWTRVSEERTSQLDWVPPQIIKRVIVRPRYVRKERFAMDGSSIPAGRRLFTGGMPGCSRTRIFFKRTSTAGASCGGRSFRRRT